MAQDTGRTVATARRVLPPFTMLAPVPAVMVACRGVAPASDRPNIITVAWAGTVCTTPPMVSISVKPSRFSYEQILSSGEFTVNLVDETLAKACDLCGVRSGRDLDKFAACGLTALPAEGLEHAPLIAESPLALCCRVQQTIELGSHTMILARVVAVSAQERLLDPNGRLCLERAKLISYIHGSYHATGRPLGFFGYSVASPAVLRRRMPPAPGKRRRS